MFDRVHHPARGRRGGQPGAPTTIAQDDGVAMPGKGKQAVPHGRRVLMAFPGGAGHGDSGARDRAAIYRDLAYGYISAEAAHAQYGLTPDEIRSVVARAKAGEVF